MTRRPFTIARLALIAFTVMLIAGLAVFMLRRPEPARRVFSDGTEALFISGATIEPAAGFPQPREIRADGEFFLTVPDGTTPLIVRSRLLILTITGASALRLTARSHETGEQVEVVSGSVVAKKNYSSSYAEPDHLGPGEMSMVNQTIDLMEKETFDPAEARAWSEQLRHRAGRSTR